jgi:hypothetical protein
MAREYRNCNIPFHSGYNISVEEASQVLFKSRNASLGDLGASYLGILAFSGLAVWANQATRHWGSTGKIESHKRSWK